MLGRSQDYDRTSNIIERPQIMIIRGLVSIFFLLTVYPASATEIGRAVLDGREIILMEDQTWAYANPEAAGSSDDCVRISSEIVPFALCLNPDEWINANLEGDTERSIKHKVHDLYIMMITERLFIERSALKKAVIGNAQNAAGLEKVVVTTDTEVVHDSLEFGKLIYKTKVSGIDVTYQNLYTSFEDIGSLQLVFFAGSGQFDDLVPFMDKAIASIDIGQ